jgi:DNA-binding MarR family transcriptional regulator
MSATNGAVHAPTAESAFRGFIRTFGLLERVMHAYFVPFGISGAQWGVLRNLYRAEQEGEAGLRLKELSQRLLIRPPSVTGVVDRLEEARLVVRLAEPSDLRAKRVALTPRGRDLVGRVLAVHGGQIARVMGGLRPEEQAQLHRLLEKFGAHLEALAGQGEGEPSAGP